jgi:endonuclease/exonuclease/phosphatase (EEP) superfamily protein YafD
MAQSMGAVSETKGGVLDATTPEGRKAMGRLIRLIAAALVAVALIGFSLPVWVWRLEDTAPALSAALDLVAHWQWLFCLLCLLALAAPFVTAHPRLGGGESGPRISVVSANVYFESSDARPLVQWVRKTNPDIVVLLEVTPTYMASFDRLSGYRGQLTRYHQAAFGVAIRARHPVRSWQVVTSERGVPRIDAELIVDGRSVLVSAVHPIPPRTVELHRLRNAELRDAARTARRLNRPAILAGDFNATPWSSAFAGIGAEEFRRATALWPTWQAGWRGWMGIPIDVIATNDRWQLVDAEVGPDIGSDHLPVRATLSFAR